MCPRLPHHIVRRVEERHGIFGDYKAVYEDGEKVGEIRTETGFFGGQSEVFRDNSGHKMVETREETTWTGEHVQRTYDSNGKQVSETQRCKGVFGPYKETRKDGKKVSETRTREGLFNTEVSETYDDEGRLVAKSVRQKRFPVRQSVKSVRQSVESADISSIVSDADYDDPSAPVTTQEDVGQSYHPLFTLLLHGSAGLATLLRLRRTARALGWWAAVNYEQDGFRAKALELYIRYGDPDEAMRACVHQDEFSKAYEIAKEHGLEQQLIDGLGVDYQKASWVAEQIGDYSQAATLLYHQILRNPRGHRFFQTCKDAVRLAVKAHDQELVFRILNYGILCLEDIRSSYSDKVCARLLQEERDALAS